MSSLNAAVSLSNTSVTLIERQCYRDACVTLRDALYLTRAAIPGDESYLPWKDSAISFALRQASACLGRSFPECGRTQRPDIKLTVLSWNGGYDLSMIQELHGTEVFAVRMDDSRIDNNVKSMHFEASVILLNYGTACRYLHSMCPRSNCDLLVEAFNAIHKAYGVLSRDIVTSLKDASQDDVGPMVTLAVLQLFSLMQLSVQLELPVQYNKYHYKFEYLMEMSASFASVPCCGCCVAPAA